MQSTTEMMPASGWRMWVARTMGAFAILFLAFDTIIKIVQASPAVEGTTQLGYPAGLVAPIGIIELVCLLVYVIPRTSILGAILLTGYLGGAIATHVRIGSPLLTHTLFPIYIAALLWGSLYLREGRLRALVPVRA